ncbi:uncharacterized protein LOC118191216 [Stegodyphus dumicola]|uniref:uncharacterized protein LOC118191216 n=1 Tax=Stegodyphus dumicola TaxID=202533 RepID=UPI0015A97C69|nr:uncharacterized protein LOC118191216 [Stegodyphus dumicola]
MKKDDLNLKSIYQLQVFLGIAISLGASVFGIIVIKNSVQCLIAKQYLCQAAALFLSAWLLAYPALTGFHGYVLFVWIYGIFYGGYIYSLKLCVFEKVRARNYARAWSLILCSQAIPSFFGLPVIHHLNQVWGLKKGYYVSSAVVFLGSVSLFLIDVHKYKLHKKKQMELQQKDNALPESSLIKRKDSHDTLQDIPRDYGDLRKAQELTCMSEEILVENFIEDYIDDCITSCNKEEKFLMLSEFENNLYKTEKNVEESGSTDSLDYCVVCSRGNQFKGSEKIYSPRKLIKTISSIDVIDEVTSSL